MEIGEIRYLNRKDKKRKMKHVKQKNFKDMYSENVSATKNQPYKRERMNFKDYVDEE